MSATGETKNARHAPTKKVTNTAKNVMPIETAHGTWLIVPHLLQPNDTTESSFGRSDMKEGSIVALHLTHRSSDCAGIG